MRQLALLLLLLAPVGSVVAAPAPFVKPPRPERRGDLERVQGEWEVVRETQCVQLDPNRKLTTTEAHGRNVYRVTIRRGQWVARIGSGFGSDYSRHTLTMSAGKIDLIDAGDGSIRRGVYSLAGHTLTVCLARANATRAVSLDVNRDGYSGYLLRRKR